jgi:hypothetical protein
MNKRIVVTLLTAILLVVSAFPATAQAQHIPITGTCTLLAMGGVFGGLQADPDYRLWETHQQMLFWRHQTWGLYCDYSDDRLDGYVVTVNNGHEVKSFNLTHAYTYTTDENWVSNDLWDGHSVGISETTKTELNGHGIYQGFLFKSSLTGTEEWDVYAVEGELIVPGK